LFGICHTSIGVMELLLDRTKFYVFGGNVTSASRIIGKISIPSSEIYDNISEKISHAEAEK